MERFLFELMKGSVARTIRPGVLGGLGGFAGLFSLDLSRYPRPVLATSTDGVGTKLLIAQQLDRHDTIGIDLVAMVIDDLVVVGAEPLFMTDYIATGKVVPDKIAAIVSGIAEGCVRAGCALVGGETAEHPGVMGADEYDISGAGTGVVNADAMLEAGHVLAGSAATVRDRLRRFVDAIGPQHNYLCAAFQWGDLTTEEARHSLDLFATEVKPALT